MNQPIRACLLAALSACAGGAAAVDLPDPSAYAYRFPLTVEYGAEYLAAPLPLDVYRAVSDPRIRDVGVYNAAGQAVPRLVERDEEKVEAVEQAVRLFVRTARTPTEPQAFELITFGKGGRFSRHNIDKTSALLEADDLERFASGR